MKLRYSPLIKQSVRLGEHINPQLIAIAETQPNQTLTQVKRVKILKF